MFHECSSLISLPDLSIWMEKKFNAGGNIFSECLSLIKDPELKLKVHYSNN